jgi:hypothetical protein
MKFRGAIFSLCLLAHGALAAEDCQMARPQPIVCQYPESAMAVDALYGDESSKLATDYMTAILQQQSCFVMKYPFQRGMVLRVRERGKLPTSDGWVGVSMIEYWRANGSHMIAWTADRNMKGKCPLRSCVGTETNDCSRPPP